MRDTEMWLAMHEECPWPGCGQCSVHDIEMSEHDAALIRLAAHIKGVPEDVFFLNAVYEGLKIFLAERGLTAEMLAVA